jgi:hypothetical protein
MFCNLFYIKIHIINEAQKYELNSNIDKKHFAV